MIGICAFIRHKKRILLCKRHAFKPFSSYWELPTNEFEGDETLEDAVEKLCFERLGKNVTAIKRKCGYNLYDDNAENPLRFYACSVNVNKMPLTLAGYTHFRWINFDELWKYNITPWSLKVILSMTNA